MKILQINKLYHPVIGGVETIVKIISEGLNNKDGLEVSVLACQRKGSRTTEKINNIQVFKAASWGKMFGMPLSCDFFRLFFKIKKDYDLFILHYPFPLASIISLFIPKKKLVIIYHSDIVRQKIGRLLFLPFINSSLNRAKTIIVSGRNIINSSPVLKRRTNKCQVVPFGINYNFTENDYQEAKKIKNNYPPGPLLLSIGRLVYYKGFKYAILAMKDIKATLIITGQGPEADKLKALIKKHKLQDKVFIIPPQPKLAPYFLACDLFIFPSCARSEAFGLVQLEALAAGKPIVNTYLQTAVEEVSIDKETGLTVESKNTAALAEAIKQLLDNDEMREQMSRNAKKRYQKLFTEEKYLENIKWVITSSTPTS